MSPAEPVACLVQGTTRRPDKPAIVLERSPPSPFRDVRSHTICGTNELLTYSIFGKVIPPSDNVPHFIREFLSKLIDHEVFKIRA